jgi:hypothetical protein
LNNICSCKTRKKDKKNLKSNNARRHPQFPLAARGGGMRTGGGIFTGAVGFDFAPFSKESLPAGFRFWSRYGTSTSVLLLPSIQAPYPHKHT